MRQFIVFSVVLLTWSCDNGTGDGDGGSDRDTSGSCEAPMSDCTEGCVNTATSADNCGECGHECQDCFRCIMGSCTPGCCSLSEIDCDPSPTELNCIEPETRSHCGSCNNACEENEICYQSRCQACEGPDVRCGNRCVDLSRDIENCGECGHVCEGMYCQCSVCVPERTDAGCM